MRSPAEARLSPKQGLVTAALLPILVAALTALTGCATTTVNLAEGPREYVATDYDSVLGRWTRTERLFSLTELETYLTATATFESWDFRWAYVVRYGQDYRLTIDQRKKLLEKALDETRQKHQFFVALYGGERKYNDLTKPVSAWIVRLIDDTGNETAPEEIVAIKKPNALERSYFPYNTVFRQAFRIRFPRVASDGRPTISAQAKWFGLRFAGAQGNSELVWQMKDDKPAKPVTMGETPKPPAQPVTMGETPKPPAQPVTMGETPKPPAQPVAMESPAPAP